MLRLTKYHNNNIRAFIGLLFILLLISSSIVNKTHANEDCSDECQVCLQLQSNSDLFNVDNQKLIFNKFQIYTAFIWREKFVADFNRFPNKIRGPPQVN